jgi:hypothetical protein
MSPIADALMSIAIVLNLLLLTLDSEGQSDGMRHFIDAASIVFTALYTAEALLKIVGLQPIRYSPPNSQNDSDRLPAEFNFWRNRYFCDPNNAADFIVVVISIASAVSNSINLTVIVVARISRVSIKLLKLIRTLKPLKGMKDVLETVIASITSLANIGCLLVLLMSVYAIVGMKFFWNIPFDGILTSHANFRSFGTALLAMFRVATVSLSVSASVRTSGWHQARIVTACQFCRVTTGTTFCTQPRMATAISPALAVVEGPLRWSSSTPSFFWPPCAC